MSFVYPGVLFGLLLGAIPIIVYYLMRFRSLRVPWGADYILERALARQRRKVYWDQIILLALRALVVMALVVAFARPQSGKKKEFGGDGTVLRILLVDESYSMLAGKGGETAREQALDAMRELVARWGRGEKWSLYVMDSHPRWVVDQKDVIDVAHSRAILETLKIEETAVSLAAELGDELAVRAAGGVLGVVERHMLEEVREARAPRFLAVRSDVHDRRHRDDRVGVVLMEDDLEAVRECVLLVLDLKSGGRLFIGRLLRCGGAGAAGGRGRGTEPHEHERET
jgi:hypothetical protein